MLDPKLRAIAAHQASQALTRPTPRLRPDGLAHAMRIEAVEAGALDATFGELNYRQLFPSLDRGIYCAHHAVGRPSAHLLPALRDHLLQLEQFGMGAFNHGWELIPERFANRVRTLLRQSDGDVLHVQNFSDGLSAMLFAGLEGRLLCGTDHFTAGRYLHARWAHEGQPLHEIEGDADEWVPTEAYIAALTADTQVVSISSAHWRTGQVHDLPALFAAMAKTCPDATLLLDVYQTLGSIELDLTGLPARTAILGGGIKQLHTGAGCGFVWATLALLESLEPNRSGWFAHAEPFAFAPDFTPAAGAARFQTGAPNTTAMAAFLAETDVLFSLGADPLPRVHERIRNTVVAAVDHARALDLQVAGDPGAAFLAIRTTDGAAELERAASQGVVFDFRPDVAGGAAGLLRFSTGAAAFEYELLYALEALR